MEMIDKGTVISKLHGAKEYIQHSYDCEIAGIAVNGLLIAAIDAIVPAIESVPTIESEHDVNRAAILRLCNEIEDAISEAWNCDVIEYDKAGHIISLVQAIGKELTGDAGSKID